MVSGKENARPTWLRRNVWVAGSTAAIVGGAAAAWVAYSQSKDDGPLRLGPFPND